MTSTKEMQARKRRERKEDNANKRTVAIVEAIKAGKSDTEIRTEYNISQQNVELWRKAVARMKNVGAPKGKKP